MALRKELVRRYGSVEQFANDLRRHLNGHPVTARPDTAALPHRQVHLPAPYRGLRRLLFMITMVGGILATSWQWHVANLERDPRRETLPATCADWPTPVLFELHDAIMPLPGSTHARELLVKRAQQYLDSLASESSGDDGLQRERAMAYERIGDVLGLPVQANLGQSAEALVSYRKALEIEKGLIERDPGNEGMRRDLARLYNRICRVQENTGKFQESVESCRQAVGIEEKILAHRPSDIDSARAILPPRIRTWRELTSRCGDWPHSEEQRRHVLQEFQELHRLQPESETFLYGLANAYHRMANLQEQTKHYAEARTNILGSHPLVQPVLRALSQGYPQAPGLDLRAAAPRQYPDFHGRPEGRARRAFKRRCPSASNCAPWTRGTPRADQSGQ